jgi:glycosyltransferase involved in cell wall biosynthesis
MISVCIATYNGEKYIKLQIDSILSQLEYEDEIIVVDDASTDNTVNIIKSINDFRIKVFINTINLGFVKTFEKSINLSNGEVIFFSDQDDYWLDNRVNIMYSALKENNKYLVVSQYITSQVQGKLQNENSIIPNLRKYYTLRSIFFGGSLYFGSTMCIDRRLLKFILPFRCYVKAHDLHIAIISILLNKVLIIDDSLTIRTITGVNLSNPNRSILRKIKSRLNYFTSLIFHLPIRYLNKL